MVLVVYEHKPVVIKRECINVAGINCVLADDWIELVVKIAHRHEFVRHGRQHAFELWHPAVVHTNNVGPAALLGALKNSVLVRGQIHYGAVFVVNGDVGVLLLVFVD